MENQPISVQIEAFSQKKIRGLQQQTSEIEDNITNIARYLKEDVSTKIQGQKDQVIKSFESYDSELRKKLGQDLLFLFTSLKDSVSGDKPIDSFDFGNWISDSIKQLEEKTGKLHLNDVDVLNLGNDITSSWNQKMEDLKQSVKESFKDLIKPQETRTSTAESEPVKKPGNKTDEVSAMEKSEQSKKGQTEVNKSGIFGKMKGLFNKKEEEGEIKATPINLGKEKNFKYDPIKKRYIFDDEPDVQEEDDNAPPPLKTAAPKVEEKPEEKKTEEQPDKVSASDLLRPPATNTLRRKKGTTKSEMPVPSFKPMMFVPNTVEPEVTQVQQMPNPEENISSGGGNLVQRYVEKIGNIFNSADFDFDAIERFKDLVINFNKLFSKEIDERVKEYSELLLLKGEYEATETIAVNFKIKAKLFENETVKFKGLLENSLQKESQLSEALAKSENELNFYKDILKSRNEFMKIVNNSDTQMALIEANFTNLNENTLLRKQLRELGARVTELKSSYEEANINYQLVSAKYDETLQFLEQERANCKVLQDKLKQTYLQNKYKDDTIISLKRANLDSLGAYKKIIGEFHEMKEQIEILEKEMSRKNESLAYLEKELDKKEKKIFENSRIALEKENELDKYAKEFHKATEEKKNLEQKLNSEVQRHQELRWNAQNEIKNVQDTLETLQKNRDFDLKFINDLKQSVLDVESQKQEARIEISKKNQDIIDFKQNLQNLVSRISESVKTLASDPIENLLRRLENINSDSSSLIDISNDLRGVFLTMEENLQLQKGNLAVEHHKLVIQSNVLKDQINCLTSDLTSYKQKTDMFMSLGESYKEKIATLNLKIEEFGRRETNYLQRIEADNHKISNLEQMVHSKNLEIVSLKAAQASTIGEIQIASSHPSIQTINEEMITEIEKLQHIIHENNNTIETLTSKIQETEHSGNQLSRLQEINQNLERELNNASSQISHLEGVASGYEAKFNELESEVIVLRAENTDLKSHSSSLEAQIKDLKSHNSQHESQLNSLKHQYSSLETQYSNLESQKSDLESQKNNLETELNNLKEEIKALNEQKTELDSQLDEGFQQYNILLEEVNVLKAKGSELLTEKHQLAEALSAKEKELQNLKESNTDLAKKDEEIARLTNEIKQLEEKNLALENEIKTQQENHQNSSNTVETLNTEISAYKKQLEEKDIQLKSAQEAINSTQESLIADKGKLESEKARLEGENNDFKAKIETLEKDHSKLLSEKNALESEIGLLKEDLQKMNAEYSELETSVAKKFTEERAHREELEKKIHYFESLSSEKSGTQEIKVTDILQSLVEEYQGSNISNILVSLLEQSRESESNLPVFLQNLMTKVENSIETYEKNIGEMVEENKSLKESISESNTQMEQLRNSLSLFESREDNNDELKSLKELYEKKVKRLEELTSENASKTSKIEELQKAISDLEKSGAKPGSLDQSEVSPKVEELQKELQKEREEKKKLNDEYLMYQRKYRNYEEEKGTQMQSHKDIIKKLSIQVDELQKLKTPSKPKTDIKSTQFPESSEIKESEKSPEKGTDPKKSSSFLMGVAKLFLTESDMKSI